MTTRIFSILCFVFFASGCNAEKDDAAIMKPDTVASNEEVQAVFESFSKAVSEKNEGLFISLANPNGIQLVRKFTSGNLGGRGPELSELTDPKKINEKLQFPIKDQTPYSLRFQFQELPFKSFAALSNRSISAEVEALDFDSWEPLLKKALVGAPEIVSRDSVMLSSANSKYYVYVEAQIIQDMLVGGFAVFAMIDGRLKLVALINLL